MERDDHTDTISFDIQISNLVRCMPATFPEINNFKAPKRFTIRALGPNILVYADDDVMMT